MVSFCLNKRSNAYEIYAVSNGLHKNCHAVLCPMWYRTRIKTNRVLSEDEFKAAPLRHQHTRRKIHYLYIAIDFTSRKQQVWFHDGKFRIFIRHRSKYNNVVLKTTEQSLLMSTCLCSLWPESTPYCKNSHTNKIK